MDTDNFPMRIFTALRFLLAILVALPSCFGSDALSGSSGSGASSGGHIGPGFDGITLASAISTSSVSLAWPMAVGATPAASSNVKYHIYSGATPEEARSNTSLIASTFPGVTSFVDSGLDGMEFSTIYYRVTAEDAEGGITDSSKIASARLPSKYIAGTSVYSPNVESLWLTQDSSGNSCITCHSSAVEPDFSSFSSFLNSASFVIPYDGEATWNEFVLDFVNNPIPHFGYWSVPARISDMKAPLSTWIAEGALEVGDDVPPIFQFDAIANAGKYFGETGPAFNEMTVHWFEASDPESLPLNGSTTGQLEYHIYVGASSDTIDWLNPINLQNEGTNPYYQELFSTGLDEMSYTFEWTDRRCVAVVRALDASGRSETFVDPLNPTMEELALRWRNMSTNEREIVISR